MKRALALVLAMALWPAPALAVPKKKAVLRTHEAAVAVNRAWISLPPPGAGGMPAYMVLTNPAKRALVLYGAHSPYFTTAELHLAGGGGVEQVDHVSLPGRGRLLFKPGNSRILLKGARRKLKTGDTVPLVLDFGHAGRRSLLLRVLQAEYAGD